MDCSLLAGSTENPVVTDRYVTCCYEVTCKNSRPFVLRSVIVFETVNEPSDESSNQRASHSSNVTLVQKEKSLDKGRDRIRQKDNYSNLHKKESYQIPERRKFATCYDRPPSSTHDHEATQHCTNQAHIVLGQLWDE